MNREDLTDGKDCDRTKTSLLCETASEILHLFLEHTHILDDHVIVFFINQLPTVPGRHFKTWHAYKQHPPLKSFDAPDEDIRVNAPNTMPKHTIKPTRKHET